jgi:hypothetical protein
MLILGLRRFYDDQLRDAILRVKDLLAAENLPEGFNTSDQKAYFSHFATLYVQYVQVYRRLEDCHDQILQPQKRRDVFRLLESVMGRVIELHRVVQGLNGAEHPCFHDILLDLKLLPSALELPVPRYAVSLRTRELTKRELTIKELAKDYELPAVPPLHFDPVAGRKLTPLSPEQAIVLLQTAERARQARQRAMYMKVIRAQEEAERKLLEGGDAEVDPDDAATKIQKVIRGYFARKLVRRMHLEEGRLLGSVAREPAVDKNGKVRRESDKEAETRARRKMLQQQVEMELTETVDPLRKQMMDNEGAKFRDEWHDAVLEHIIQKRVATGKLDKIPTAEEGGSYKYMLDQEPKPPGEGEEEADDKKGKGKGKDKKGGKDDKKGKDKKGKKGEEEEEEKETVIEPSKFAQAMVDAAQRIIAIWENGEILPPPKPLPPVDPKAAEAATPAPGAAPAANGAAGNTVLSSMPKLSAAQMVEQGPLAIAHMQVEPPSSNKYFVNGERAEKPSIPLLREELREGVEDQLRKEADERLRMELDNMDLADGGGKGKGKGKKGKSKKGKKGKKGKGKKGKKDATEGENPDAQFQLLVSLGVIHLIEKAKVSDYVGEWNPLTPLYESQQITLDPSFADVRHAAVVHGVMSLGCSQDLHSRVPHTRGVLIYGPPSSGKTLLSRAIASETGSLWINLSPSVLEGKVEGKEVGKLISRAFRVAKAFAPSVIYIDDAEQVFAAGKKGKKSSGSGIGGKMLKDLQTKVKDLAPGDRVLIVANSRSPGSLDIKSLQSCIDWAIYTPRPDYGTRLMLWRHFITIRHHAPEFADTQLQTLAHLSEGYTSGAIANIVADVITERRLKKLDAKPLTPEEFVAPLAKRDPVWMDVFEEMTAFNESLPAPMCRKKPPKPPGEGDEEDAGKDKKKGDKKKKKK